MTTGQRIKEARKQAGMTQTELAQKLNIPFQSVSQWERDIRNPKYDTLRRIAAVLDVSVDYLLKGAFQVNSAHLAMGVHVYRNTSVYGIDVSVLDELPKDSYNLKYQDKHILVAVDKDSLISEDELNNIVKSYKHSALRVGQDRPRFVSCVPSQQESDFYRAFEENAPPSVLEKLKQNLIFDEAEEGILRHALAQWAEHTRIKINKTLDTLSPIGIEKAADCIEIIAGNPRYQAHKPALGPQEKANAQPPKPAEGN